jgi:PAS domain S-box-containing protein
VIKSDIVHRSGLLVGFERGVNGSMTANTSKPMLIGTAIILAALVFWVDSMASFDAAISIVYLAVVTLVAVGADERPVRWATAGCVALAILSWFLVHSSAPSLANLLRVTFSTVAISVTGALLVSRKRLQRARADQEASRADLHNFMHSVPHILWRATPEARVDLYNKRYSEVVGRNHSPTIASEEWLEDLHPDDRERGTSDVRTAFAAGQQLHTTLRLRQADGGYRWMSLVGRPVFGADGELLHYYGGTTDVHEEVIAREEAQRLRDELEKSQAELVNFLDSVPQILWRSSPQAHVDYYNKRFTEVIGRDWRKVIEEQSWIEDFHPDDRAWFLERVRNAFAAGEELRATYRQRQADGTYRWASLIGRPFKDENGKVVRYYGGTTDIHDEVTIREELLRTREELERSRAELENFADSVPQIQWRMTPDFRVDYLNEQFAEFTGRSREQAIETQNWVELHDPDGVESALAHFRQAAKSGEDQVRFYHRLLHKDGSYRWMKQSGRAVRSPETGEIVKWYGGMIDAHEEVLAQQQLQDLLVTLERRVEERTAELLRTEARYASLFEVSNMTFAEMDFSAVQPKLDALRAAGVVDLRGYLAERPHEFHEMLSLVRTIRVNEALARLLGYTDVAELVANPPTQNAKDGDEVQLRQFEMAFYGDDHIDGRTVLIGKNGSEIPVYYAVIRLADGLHLSSHLNLTEQERIEDLRRAAQEELARANRVATVGAFSASIAHELNQPIASMVMDAQTGLRWLQRSPPEIPAAEKILERLAKSAQRVSGIVQRTRESIVAGRRSVEALDLGKLVSETRDLIEPDLRRAEIALEISCPAGPLPVRGDPIDLQQVLVNLVNNAADALRDQAGDRLIKIAVYEEEHETTVSVSDTGPGIPPEHLDKLFQPFFTTKPSGIGMGLQICRSAIEALGGTMCVVNLPERGACFTFKLTRVGDAAAIG